MSGEDKAAPKDDESAKGKDPDKPSPYGEALSYFVQRASDAGYLPFVIICLFALGLAWVLTRNMDSHDTRDFLEKLTGAGWVWLGWVIALAEVPVGRWVLKRCTADRDRWNARLQGELEEARRRLKEQASKQPGLDLGLESDQKKVKLNPE